MITKEEADAIIAEQDKGTKIILELIAKVKEVLGEENALAKSLLYCTERTCDNCGFVDCENFQRQRKSEPCALYISYQDRIRNLVHENEEQKQQIEKMKRCEICKHYHWESCNYHSNWVKQCKENGMKLFELKEIKEK